MVATEPTAAARLRRHRAAVARRLIERAPDAVAALDWDACDRAPAWLALDDAGLTTFQCRVGAVLCARALRLWIDGPRLAAARAILGDDFLAQVLAQPDSASIPLGLVGAPRIDSATQVGPALQSAGASVLLASLAHGPLRQAVGVMLAPAAPSTMTHELADTLVARAHALDHDAAARVAA